MSFVSASKSYDLYTHVDSVLYILDVMISYDTCTCVVVGLLQECPQLITFVSSLVYQLCHMRHDFGSGTTYFNIFPLWDVTRLRLVVSCIGGQPINSTFEQAVWVWE